MPSLPSNSSSSLTSLLISILQLSLPSILLQITSFLPYPITTSYLGHLSTSKTVLSTFSLAGLTGNVCAVMLIVGTMSANDTLNPVVYTANPRNLYPLVLRGVILCLIILVIPTMAFYVPASEPIATITLRKIGVVDEQLLDGIRQYLQVFGLFLPFFVLYEGVKRYFICQGVIYPVTASGAIGVVTHWILAGNWVAVEGLTTSGVIRRTAIAHGLQPIIVGYLMVMYGWYYKPHDRKTIPKAGFFRGVDWGEVWDGRKVRQHLGLSLSGIMSLSEWMYWEVQTFLISSLNDRLFMTSQAVVQSMVPLFYMAPLGLSIGASVIIGKHIGQGDVNMVKKSVRLVARVGVVLAVVMGGICYMGREGIVGSFTNNEDVKDTLSSMWLGVTLFVIVDQVYCVQAKILVSLGLQSHLGRLVVVCLYLFGIPLIYYSGIKGGEGITKVWGVAWVPYAVLNGGMYIVRKGVDYEGVVEVLREEKGGGGGEYKRVGREEDAEEEDGEEVWEDAIGFEGEFEDEVEDEGFAML